MSLDLKKLNEILNSPESDELIKKIKEKEKLAQKNLQRKLKNFHKENHHRLSQIINNALLKYNCDNYVNKWYSRGQEPPTEFAWFLFKYAKKYGRKCTREEREKYINDFTVEIYCIDDFCVQIMCGQGSVIEINKLS
jgi:hypothetical protein